MLSFSSSTSRSSSSSVRNPYDSSSDRRRNGSDLENEFDFVKYKCDLPSPLQEAWKEGTLDLERRFFGCSRYKDPWQKCNFFVWTNPPYTDRARIIIKDLKMRLKKKEDDLHNANVDTTFSERKTLVLHEKLCALRKKNEDTATLLKKMEKKCAIMYRLLGVIVLVFMFWLIN